MEKETQLQEIIRLHRNCSARFGGHVLRLLLENGNGNIAVSPARLQAVLVLLANWTTPEIRKRILDMAKSEVISHDEANILFDFANIKPIPYKDYTMKDEYGNSIPLNPTLEQQTILWNNKGSEEVSPTTVAIEQEDGIDTVDRVELAWQEIEHLLSK